MNRSDMVALKAKEIKKEVQRELEGRLDIDDEEVLKIIDEKIRIKNCIYPRSCPCVRIYSTQCEDWMCCRSL